MGCKSVRGYHQKPASAGYHNLTDNASIPQNLGRLLFLSRKFTALIHYYDAFLERFQKDVRTKRIFRDNHSQPPRLCCRNEQWQPDPASETIETALQNFKQDLQTVVTSKFIN